MGQFLVAERQETAHVDQRIFFGAHDAGVGQAAHVVGNFEVTFRLELRLVLMDEIGVFRHPTHVEHHRNVEFMTNGGYLAGIFHADRLTAAAVVGHRKYHRRYVGGAPFGYFLPQAHRVQIALERVSAAHIRRFGTGQIHSIRSAELDIGPSAIEVGVG